MFTGIITDIGEITSIKGNQFTLDCSFDANSIALGASIACDGCCLTATDIEAKPGGGCFFSVDVSNETLEHTTLGQWSAGRRVNLERSLSLRDELGGHIVTGHVDAVAPIISRVQDDACVRFILDIPVKLAHLVAKKGSVALDGVSLTVNEIDGTRASVNIVPHTLEYTTWSSRGEGDMINLEVDLLARYVARISDVLNEKQSG